MTSESRHLIAALHNTLSELELTAGPGRDEKSFADLKRILKQRIQDLEDCGAVPARAARTAKAANISD